MEIHLHVLNSPLNLISNYLHIQMIKGQLEADLDCFAQHPHRFPQGFPELPMQKHYI